MKKTVDVLGIPIVHTTLNDLAAELVRRAEQKEKAFVVTANPEIIMKAEEDPAYRESLLAADFVTADGIGVVKGAELLGSPLPERVAGFDLFMRLLATADHMQQSVYFLGAKEETLQKALAVVREEFPGIEIAGSHHGYFDMEDDSIAKDIAEKQPDYVFAALGLPRQEKWIAQYSPSFDHGVFMGIGGSFDVLAGEMKRAPKIWQKLHVEWLYRLMVQPSRIKRMGALPRFAVRIMREKRKR
ncbi:WecB/TagA/CpsF family glycosyltransferase [Alkalicoccus chagannorensis]|uniref:WecB/TagA/CpsF family glycosyltransferase n=1 Tax=Alkalicoccus chagannorensis TaxID=427072 RepID=UPI0004182876|nr:WecB/TagA/CpsF family glycosyltransferase [Alkalicoccus chagannorensis]